MELGSQVSSVLSLTALWLCALPVPHGETAAGLSGFALTWCLSWPTGTSRNSVERNSLARVFERNCCVITFLKKKNLVNLFPYAELRRLQNRHGGLFARPSRTQPLFNGIHCYLKTC